MAGNHMALDIRIAGRYRLGRKIGSGSFGDIYLGAWEPAWCPAEQVFGLISGKEMCRGRCHGPHPGIPCAGTHIQTGEEVGIKLVRAGSCAQCMPVL